MKKIMKTILALALLWTAAAQAQYGTGWSGFNSGDATVQNATATHRGVFNGWLQRTMQSANYSSQPAIPNSPVPSPAEPAPFLNISVAGASVRVSWLPTVTTYDLETSPQMGAAATWVLVPGPYSFNGVEHFVFVPISGTSAHFRLVTP